MWGVLGVQGIRKESQGVREGQEVRPTEGFTSLKASGVASPFSRPRSGPRVSADNPGHLAGAASRVHVLFFKEVWRLSGTLGDKSAAGAWPAPQVPAPP